MPHIPLKIKLTRSTSCLAPFTATGEILCSDRIPQGQRSFMLVLIDWDEKAGEVEIFFNKPTSGGGDIRFDGPDGPTKKVIDEDTRKIFVIYGQAPTAGSTPDVELVVRDKKTEYSRVPMSVGPTATDVQIKAENGTDAAQLFMVPETNTRFKAVATPAAAGTFRWASVPSSAVEIKGDRDKELVEVAAHAPSGFRPKGFDNAPALCVLFTPAGGPAVMAVHRIWPLARPEEPGPFPVGRTIYTAPNFTIAGGLEGWPLPIEVTLEALVRYPAQQDGDGKPFSTQRSKYPMVILAHGRHGAVEFERNPDGSRKLDVSGHPIPIRTSSGDLAEFHSYEGLEYLASHLASYGFVAVSINLNGKFNSTTGRGELVEPQGDVVSCRPFMANQAAIAHRGLTILRHIQTMEDKNGTDPLFLGKIDVDKVALIGHSRGGEAVVEAHDINRALSPTNFRAVVSIAPTDNRHIEMDIPYAVILGSDDGDVSDGSGLRLYDRARPPRQLIWVIGAIHNYFSSNWHWQDEVLTEPPVSRPQHQNIAKGYCNVFLQQYLNGVTGVDRYFTGDIRLASLSGVELHHAYQTTGGLIVDQFEEVLTDKSKNTLGQSVTAPTVRSFDELVLHRLTPTPPFVLGAADVPDLLAGKKDLRGCLVNLRSWYHDTNGLMVEWNSATARYTTSLPNSSVAGFDVLSFRVAQDVSVNPAGGRQDFKVRLTDSAGQHATLKVSDFATIPFPRKKELDIGSVASPIIIDFTKSVLTTVRLPLGRFKQSNSKLNLGSVASITFELSEKVPGKLGFDDLEFSK